MTEASSRIGAIGVGFGGPVDWRTGRISRSHQIEGWENFELAGWVREVAGGVTVVVDNDANVGALGEWAHLRRASSATPDENDSLFYVTLGSGVGGGLIVGRQIYHGDPPGESEFGHLRLDRDGTIVESRCSGWAVDRRIRELRDQGPQGILARAIGDTPGGEARHLAAAIDAGDVAARRLLDDVARDLAFALSHVVHLMHPAVVVIGGGLSLVGAKLADSVASALPQHVMHVFHPIPTVQLAALGEDAVPLGALELAARNALR